ncbi:hypothetical protein CHUAL_002320 [Chamberlinius hualienensis]
MAAVSENGDDVQKRESISSKHSSRGLHGLNVGQTAFFIMGEIAGSGVVALPYAILQTGYIGIVLLVVFCFLATYCGILLGKCWVMLEERYEECRTEVRQPYQEIGLRTYGRWLSIIISGCIQVYQIGVCVVYTLLVADMLRDLVQVYWPGGTICYWEIIVVAAFLPTTWFQTPKDFWVIAVGAAFSIIIASLLLTIQAVIDSTNYDPNEIHYPPPTFKNFTLALGTVLFAYGGATALPTYQNDMKSRKKFSLAATFGFLGTLLVYFPVAVTGYFVYGYLLTPNVAQSIENRGMRVSVQSLIIFHLMCALVLTANPAFQVMEDILKIKPGFSVIKTGFRTFVVLGILFIGETVPKFSVILDLLGGAINPFLCFIFPIVCYVKLVQTQPDGRGIKKRTIPLHEKIFMGEIVIVVFLVGICATVSAITELVSPQSLSLPCYVQ